MCLVVRRGEDVFDESVTHVVVHDLRRTAKLLGGCLAGKVGAVRADAAWSPLKNHHGPLSSWPAPVCVQWVLRPDYLDACAAAGRFVEEAEYEWGAREEDGPQVREREGGRESQAVGR